MRTMRDRCGESLFDRHLEIPGMFQNSYTFDILCYTSSIHELELRRKMTSLNDYMYSQGRHPWGDPLNLQALLSAALADNNIDFVLSLQHNDKLTLEGVNISSHTIDALDKQRLRTVKGLVQERLDSMVEARNMSTNEKDILIDNYKARINQQK